MSVILVTLSDRAGVGGRVVIAQLSTGMLQAVDE